MENVDVSIVFCLFEYQMIGDFMTKIRIPVWDLHDRFPRALALLWRTLADRIVEH
jgi:hypothetical protein